MQLVEEGGPTELIHTAVGRTGPSTPTALSYLPKGEREREELAKHDMHGCKGGKNKL